MSNFCALQTFEHSRSLIATSASKKGIGGDLFDRYVFEHIRRKYFHRQMHVDATSEEGDSKHCLHVR